MDSSFIFYVGGIERWEGLKVCRVGLLRIRVGIRGLWRGMSCRICRRRVVGGIDVEWVGMYCYGLGVGREVGRALILDGSV